MSVASTKDTTPCMTHAAVFQHPMLEDVPLRLSSSDRRKLAALTRQAETLCLSCPLMAECLYSAVVAHDVAGHAGATSPHQRSRIRAILGVTVQPEDFGTVAGATSSTRQVDHAAILRLRAANPHESLEALAQRIGCSVSTVKRHLRDARHGKDTPTLTPVRPSMEQVARAWQVVTGRSANPTGRQSAA